MLLDKERFRKEERQNRYIGVAEYKTEEGCLMDNAHFDGCDDDLDDGDPVCQGRQRNFIYSKQKNQSTSPDICSLEITGTDSLSYLGYVSHCKLWLGADWLY